MRESGRRRLLRVLREARDGRERERPLERGRGRKRGRGASADADAGASAGAGADAGASADADAGASAGAGADAGASAGADASAGAGAGADAGASAGAGAGASAGAGLAGMLRPGVNLAPAMISGPSATFQMPENVIIPRNGVSPSYGLVILFNFACAGDDIELLPYDPNSGNPQQIPIGCFDSNHNQLGPDDFVFGFTRVYAYDRGRQLTEVNPVITRVDVGNGAAARYRRRHERPSPSPCPCASTATPATAPSTPIGPVVPPSLPSGKQVWADFYSTVGTFSSTARLLYDPMVTLTIPSGTNNNFFSPTTLAGAPGQELHLDRRARRSGRRGLGYGPTGRDNPKSASADAGASDASADAVHLIAIADACGRSRGRLVSGERAEGTEGLDGVDRDLTATRGRRRPPGAPPGDAAHARATRGTRARDRAPGACRRRPGTRARRR